MGSTDIADTVERSKRKAVIGPNLSKALGSFHQLEYTPLCFAWHCNVESNNIYMSFCLCLVMDAELVTQRETIEDGRSKAVAVIAGQARLGKVKLAPTPGL